MAEMHNIDPNFEPQSRPRSGTWPLNRPNIQPRKNRMQEMGGTILDTTLEEANSQELIAGDLSMNLEPQPLISEDYLSLLSQDSMLNQSEFLIGLPLGPTANLVEEFSTLSNVMVKTEPNNNNSVVDDYCTTTTITELSNLNEAQNFEDVQSTQQAPGLPVNFAANGASSLSKSPPSANVLSTPSSAPSACATPKAKSTRKNAWGNMSYADLITQAIEAAPEKRLTLAQIYEWMVKNVPYFKDKGDSNSSAGWKNSIRHNLSLHAKFKRIQNEGTGKSSWWVINHDAKPGKPRRRAISMDNPTAKYSRSKNKAKQKAEYLKKQKAGMKPGESSSWSRDITSGLETTVSNALGSEYRNRVSSNASSIGGRMSPTLFQPQDLEADGAPPLSPLGSSTNLASMSASPPTAFNTLFDIVRQDNASSTIPELNLTDQENLLESLASMDVVSSPVTYTDQSIDSKAGIYLQQINGDQQNPNMKKMGKNVAQNSPNLASLLQKNTNSPKKPNQKQIKPEPEWNDSKVPFMYSEYQNQQMMNQNMSGQYKSQLQQQMNEVKPIYRYVLPRQNIQENTQYVQNTMQPPRQVQQQQPQVSYMQQQQGLQQYMTTQQRPSQMVPTENQLPPPLYPGQQSNLVQMGHGKFPSDINLDNQELYDSGDLDMDEVLRDMPNTDYSLPYNFGMDFEAGGGKPASFYQQTQMQDSREYNMGMNGGNNMMENMRQQQQQQQPTMHPNPDVFITNSAPGSNSMDMMMEGCRMNNANFQHIQPGQTPPVGAASSYTMQ